LFVRDQRQIFQHRLRQEHAIEWIPVMTGDIAGALGMTHGHCELAEAFCRDRAGNVVSNRTGIRELAEAVFRCDLPCRGRAYEDLIFDIVLNGGSRPARKLGIGERLPEEGVRVEQQAHVAAIPSASVPFQAAARSSEAAAA
jgi:hypothetical protein